MSISNTSSEAITASFKLGPSAKEQKGPSYLKKKGVKSHHRKKERDAYNQGKDYKSSKEKSVLP